MLERRLLWPVSLLLGCCWSLSIADVWFVECSVENWVLDARKMFDHWWFSQLPKAGVLVVPWLLPGSCLDTCCIWTDIISVFVRLGVM